MLPPLRTIVATLFQELTHTTVVAFAAPNTTWLQFGALRRSAVEFICTPLFASASCSTMSLTSK